MPIDYATLRVIWWVLLGLLLIGFAIMDGFDLGIGMLLHRVAKTDDERRVTINTIGPIWEGNQIWLILGAGAIFAAWPDIYAVSFSGFYFAMLAVLFSLILRPVGFKYRGKVNHPTWRKCWDFGLFLGGFIPALVFGIAVGNVLQGVPFNFDNDLLSYFTGSFVSLFNPFALLCGLLSVSMFVMHGSVFLTIKTNDPIQSRAINYARLGAVATVTLFLFAGYLVTKMQGFALVNFSGVDGPSNPLHKKVIMEAGAWIHNYKIYPWIMCAPALGIGGALLAISFVSIRCGKLAWLASSISIASIIATFGLSMFPFILPSSSHPDMSLIVWDASSSHLTLFIMLIATLIFLPLIILYTSWVYYVLRGKVTSDYIKTTKGLY